MEAVLLSLKLLLKCAADPLEAVGWAKQPASWSTEVLFKMSAHSNSWCPFACLQSLPPFVVHRQFPAWPGLGGKKFSLTFFPGKEQKRGN